MLRNLESLMTTYMVCNLISLSSTCTNPILYGYLNKNIQEVIMKRVSDLSDSICDCFDAIKVSFVSVKLKWKWTIQLLLPKVMIESSLID